MTHRDPVVVAGYLVRCPLGGYAWQVLHYLAGLRALGFDPYFYEDTAFYSGCFDPRTGQENAAPDTGLRFAANLFAGMGFGNRWVFRDTTRNAHHGLSAADTASLLHDARFVLTLAAVNRLPRRGHQRRVFIDIDPGVTQLRLEAGDVALRELVADHDLHFTIGENIGTARCPVPSGGFRWRPTRQPIALDWWEPLPPDESAAYTTIGRWAETGRDIEFRGETYLWRKRTEWLRFIDLPGRTGERFAIAMDVDKVPGDPELLERHGWEITDPIAVSQDAFAYRDFIRRSKAEFTVAKDLNIRLATGWFSDRSACYLAAGRPVITQQTGLDAVLPTGEGLFAVRSPAEAVDAVTAIARDYHRHTAAARRIAVEYFDARRVLEDLVSSI